MGDTILIPDLGSERRRLNWLACYLSTHFHFDREPSVEMEGEAVLYVVSASYRRRALVFAEGISTLLKAELVEATSPLERSLWELWVEFRYLHQVGDPEENAVKAQVTALLEMLAVADSQPGQFDEEIVEGVRAPLTSFRQGHPGLVAAVEAQRKKRRYHWSGKTVAAMLRELGEHPNIYKSMSWEAHSVLTPIVDLHRGEEPGAFELAWMHDSNDGAFAEHVAFTAGGVLYSVWNQHADRFGEELLEAAGDDVG